MSQLSRSILGLRTCSSKIFNSSDQYQMKYERFAGLVSVLQTTQSLELKKRRRQHLDDTKSTKNLYFTSEIGSSLDMFSTPMALKRA